MRFVVPTVSVTFTYTRDEYIRAMRRHYRWRLQLSRDIISGCLAIGLGLYLTRTIDIGWLGWGLVGLGVVLLMLVGYALFVMPLLIYRTQPKLKDRYTLRFAEERIEFKTDKIDSELQWSLYQSWRFDDNFYVLFYGKRDLTVVPRRALDEASDRHLRVLLTQKLGEPKSLVS